MIRSLIIVCVFVLADANFLFAASFTHRMEFSSQESTEESKPHSSLTHRQEIRELTSTQLQELRDAFKTAEDNGRFAEVARDHGYPNWQCPHGDVRFLPWRRFIISTISSNPSLHLCTVERVCSSLTALSLQTAVSFVAWRLPSAGSPCLIGTGRSRESLWPLPIAPLSTQVVLYLTTLYLALYDRMANLQHWAMGGM